MSKLTSIVMLCVLVMTCKSQQAQNEVRNASSEPQKPLNVLLLLVDDYRVAMGAMGDKRAITPNLDKLAAQGMLFNRAYTNVPVCGASRASLMTSIYPHRTRFVDYLASAEREVPSAYTLPSVFKNAGYYTVSNGKVFHHRNDSNEKSWTESAWEPDVKGPAYFSEDSKNYMKASKRFGPRGPWYESADLPDEVYYDGQVKQKTLNDLERLAKTEQPFFIAAGFRRPHLPFNAPQKYFDRYSETDFQPHAMRVKPLKAPDALKGSGEIHMYHFKNEEYNSDEFHRLSLLGYYANVSFIDQQVGDILDKLDELNLRDNTIVVLTSDHGFHLGEYNFWGKHNMLSNALHIPLIVDAPNKKDGQKSNAIVSLVDLFPTLLSLADLTPSNNLTAQMMGNDFSPLLLDPQAAHQEYAYSRFKQGDTVISKDFMYTEYITEQGDQSAMLFDLRNDPNESTNVVNKIEYRQDVKRLSGKLKEFIRISEVENKI